MTPSSVVLADAAQVRDVTDVDGRRLSVRRLTALDRLRLYKALGDALAGNDAYFSLAYLAASVTEVDGVPLPWPASEMMLEANVTRLGDAGLEAVVEALEQAAASRVAPAGNGQGTPS